MPPLPCSWPPTPTKPTLDPDGVDVWCAALDHPGGSIESARENAALRSVPSDRRLEAFFNLWTPEEAYLKAIGEGLSRPLDQFDVSLAPGERPARQARAR